MNDTAAEPSTLDPFDLRILAALSRDGRMSITDLAKQVGLTKTPCQIRLKRLQGQGYILGFRAQLNLGKLGRDHIAFVEVRLQDTTEQALTAFNGAVSAVPEIEQCHMIAGAFDYLLKVRTTDIKSYRQVLGEVISALPHVASTSTHVSMQSVKDDSNTTFNQMDAFGP
ncbi:Lrp/AsnC family transcriptional regulator [Actibacterium sp. 188UL27-1]|uniref:Lrp/AsnC family transcriptional regulator n=1 Tax=Actibacterium sp. 188UL27-1 TaxID=2786961 RepID=UPI0019574E2F|nr:Lrp/AsnC family transcriptional regulator [Actibacterium sp. 188UL27-1]MBM7067395.1 Lrp/AsnC family transcriptional regulator [Actibacterium sp. 188UL27-1]